MEKQGKNLNKNFGIKLYKKNYFFNKMSSDE